MFLPLHDGIALRYLRRARATISLLALTTLIHFCIVSALFGPAQKLDLGLGLIPALLFGSAILGPDILHIPAWLTLVTSLFIHGSVWHLAGNMLFLWVLGDNVEDAMGSLSFLTFYILCGTGAGLSYAFMNSGSQSPLIGASGAISGVAAAYVMLYPRARIVGLLFNLVPVSLSAAVVISVWIAWQLASALLAADSHIGWWAHAGGIATGAVLLPLFKRRDVPWFGQRTE